MKETSTAKKKGSFFDNPILRTKIKSANAKIFPEGLLGYFLGPTLALISNSILSSYLNQYFTDVLGLGTWAPTFLSLLPVISVIAVVAGNIVIGRLMDHVKTRAGKARPILLLALPLCVLALLVLFVFTPFPVTGEEGNNVLLVLILLAVGYNLWFAVAYPFYFTPHSALVNLSTRNSTHRSLIATISNATTLAAMGLCSMIFPFFLGLVFKSGDPEASHMAWKIFSIALMIITAVGIIIEYMFTRERITEETMEKGEAAEAEPKKKAVPIGKQLKACFADKYWWIIIGLFFFYQLGGMLKNSSQLYFCTIMFPGEIENAAGAVLGEGYSTAIGGGFHGTLSIIGAIPTALGMLLAWPLANKIGKSRAIVLGSALAVVGGVIGLIVPDSFPVVVTSFVVKALGSTPAMYLSLALLADVLDHQEAMNGFRTDGFTMTIYGAIMAGMTGIASGIILGVINSTEYSAYIALSPENAVNNVAMLDSAQTIMPWIFIGGETICYGLILLINLFMGVEKFGKFDHKAIIIDQRALAAAEGREYEPPAVVMAREEAEANAKAEEQRIAESKAKCEKKGLDFEAEEAKYQEAKKAKEAAAAAKKAAKEEQKKAKEAAKQAEFDALPEEEKAKRLAAAEAKKAKQAERDEKILAEFNALREKYGRTLLTAEDMAEENKPAEAAEAPEAEAVKTVTETAESAAEDKPDDGKTE